MIKMTTLPLFAATIWARKVFHFEKVQKSFFSVYKEKGTFTFSPKCLCPSDAFLSKSLTYINQNFHFNRCTHLKLNIPSFTRNANPNNKCKMIIMWNISLKPLAVKRKGTHLSLFFPSGSRTLVHEQSIWYLYWQEEMCDFKTSSSSAVT